jgi:hypothetical protein
MEGGKFREIPVDKVTTPSGTFAMQTATNAAPIYLPDGSIAQNYTAEANYGGAPAPMAGGGAFAGTNAPTAAPTPQPAPTPSYTMTQAEASQRFGTNMPVGTHRVPKLGGVLVITP